MFKGLASIMLDGDIFQAISLKLPAMAVTHYPFLYSKIIFNSINKKIKEYSKEREKITIPSYIIMY